MRRLPMRSMSTKATQVKIKLVTATDIDVSVGLAKPRRVNIVAEKYIKEFYTWSVRGSEETSEKRTRADSYKAAKLLKPL